MKKETIYFNTIKKKCKCCGERSAHEDEDSKICIDCEQENEFYEMTMKGL